MQRGLLAGDRQQRSLVRGFAPLGEVAEHLVVRRDLVLPPVERDVLQPLDRPQLLPVVRQILHVGHDVDVIPPVGHRQAEGRAGRLRLGRRIAVLLLVEVVVRHRTLLDQFSLLVVEQHAQRPDALDRGARRAGIERRSERPELQLRGHAARTLGNDRTGLVEQHVVRTRRRPEEPYAEQNMQYQSIHNFQTIANHNPKLGSRYFSV